MIPVFRAILALGFKVIPAQLVLLAHRETLARKGIRARAFRATPGPLVLKVTLVPPAVKVIPARLAAKAIKVTPVRLARRATKVIPGSRVLREIRVPKAAKVTPGLRVPRALKGTPARQVHKGRRATQVLKATLALVCKAIPGPREVRVTRVILVCKVTRGQLVRRGAQCPGKGIGQRQPPTARTTR